MPFLRRHVFALSLVGTGVGARLVTARGTLLYPDGYQYLLMARGIAAHLRPVIQLGRGGDFFVPSADAAAKPLYPAMIALLHTVGFGWRSGATVVSSVSGGVAVALAGLVAARLTGSRTAGALTSALFLVSPGAREWSAYAVPDSLAQALALGAVLAVLDRRFRIGGVLAGLALLARPELGLLLLASAAASTLRAVHRPAALRIVTAGAITAALGLAVLRPPLQLSLHIALAATGVALVGASVLAPPRWAVAGGVLAVIIAGALAPAIAHLAVGPELPLVLLALGGLVTATTRACASLAIPAGALSLLYAWKNPGSGRYAADLVPLAAIAAGFVVTAVPYRRVAIAVATGAAVVGALVSAGPLPARDPFATIASELPRSNTPLVTAAADAYGFLLYPRPVRWLRPGARGVVLVDGASRAYEPGAVVHGRVVARLAAGSGFLRPDGRLDHRPAFLVIR